MQWTHRSYCSRAAAVKAETRQAGENNGLRRVPQHTHLGASGCGSALVNTPKAALVARLRMLSPSAHMRLTSGYSDADLFDLEGDGFVDAVLSMPRSVCE